MSAFVRAPMIAAVLASMGAGLLAGQESGLRFEVASIKPSTFPSDEYAAGFRAAVATNPCGSGRLSVSGTLITVLTGGICGIVRIAYDVKSFQVVGMPATLGHPGQGSRATDGGELYDIEARAPGPDPPNADQVREMLRSLLRDRFALTLHRESRDLSFYALVPTNDGPKLTPAVATCKPTPNPMPERMSVCGQTMGQVAGYLTSFVDRPVLDMTGVTGKFDYEIPIDPSGGDLKEQVVAGIQERLKLKLQSRKGPVEVLVIDHVKGPLGN
jgi:uncharacterized protein (TIGR03435 family)